MTVEEKQPQRAVVKQWMLRYLRSEKPSSVDMLSERDQSGLPRVKLLGTLLEILASRIENPDGDIGLMLECP